MAIDNTGSRPLQFDPSTVAVQDVEGFLYRPGYVSRTPESMEAEPDFSYGEIAPGASLQGALEIPVINGTELARVIFQPAHDRLIILANLGRGAGGRAGRRAAIGAGGCEPGGGPNIPKPGRVPGERRLVQRRPWPHRRGDRPAAGARRRGDPDRRRRGDGADRRADCRSGGEQSSRPLRGGQPGAGALRHYRAVLQTAIDVAESGDQADIDALFTDLAAANQGYHAAWNQISDLGQDCVPLG